MFGDKTEKMLGQMAHDLEPYRQMALGYEVDQRLSNMELDLLGYNRHLLTSNDRYQLAAAYLHLAQNRTTVMDALYDGMASPSQTKEKGEIDVDAVSDFLAGGYRSASELLEEADRILAYTGFQASPADSARLSGVMKFNWPGPEVLSSRFGAGIAEAASNLVANGGSLLQNTTTNQLLPNDFRMEIVRQVTPLLSEAGNHQKSIDRLTGGLARKITSEAVLRDIYEDLIKELAFADQVAVWLTIPRLYNPTFTLSKPLNELQPVQKRFDPNTIGQPVVKTVVQQPPVPSKPFHSDILTAANQPKEAALPKPAPSHPFDASVLDRDSEQSAHPAPEKPEHHFDASVLHHATDEGKSDTPAASQPKKPFDPSALDE